MAKRNPQRALRATEQQHNTATAGDQGDQSAVATLERPGQQSGDAELQRDDIARRAYELYRERGCEDGRDMDDWLQAERELKQRV